MQRLAASAVIAGNAACDHACGSGYAVVDPMPMPGKVTGVANSIVATASFGDAGARVILELKDPTFAGTSFSAKSLGADAGYAVSGGRLVSATKTKDGMIFEIDTDPGRGAVYVSLDVDGIDGGTVEATVSWGSSPDGGRTITALVVDR